MDSQINDILSSTNTYCRQSCCVSSPVISHIKGENSDSSNHVFDMNDRTTLITNCILKNKKHYCQCPQTTKNRSKSNMQSSQPWITFIHILCTVRQHFNHIMFFDKTILSVASVYLYNISITISIYIVHKNTM